MSSWLFLLCLFLIWFLWVIAVASEYAVEAARKGIPKGQRPGVSIFPIIPIFPLGFWGIALLIDSFGELWGTRIIGLFHAILAFLFIVTIVRDIFRLRSIDKTA
jgi:hypothetical protein